MGASGGLVAGSRGLVQPLCWRHDGGGIRRWEPLAVEASSAGTWPRRSFSGCWDRLARGIGFRWIPLCRSHFKYSGSVAYHGYSPKLAGDAWPARIAGAWQIVCRLCGTRWSPEDIRRRRAAPLSCGRPAHWPNNERGQTFVNCRVDSRRWWRTTCVHLPRPSATAKRKTPRHIVTRVTDSRR